MRFGQFKSFHGLALSIAVLCSFLSACTDKIENAQLAFATPFQGQNFTVGQKLLIKLESSEGYKEDSVIFLLDGKFLSKKRVADSLIVPTDGFKLGYRMISAIVSHGGKNDTVMTNVVLKSNVKPIKLGYKVVNSFPHDTSSYTQGLSYVDGTILESTGRKGSSQLRYVDLISGKAKQQVRLEPQYFGEGSVKISERIIVLTWQENVGLVYDSRNFKQLGTFAYQNSREGWGLTFDGKNILRSDGSNKIWFMNATTYKEEGYLEVYDNNGAVDSLNELEFIDGKIFANVYPSNKIVVINPANGIVESYIDASALTPKNFFKDGEEAQNNVLNGIAWDAKGRRLFVTGKKWPKLYEINLGR